MASEREAEESLSLRALGRSTIPQLAIGDNDMSKVLFSPGGDQVATGASGSYYSALWFSLGATGMEMKVDNAGAITYTAQAGTQIPSTARWPVTTRYSMVPSTRTAASSSLVLRGPSGNYVEFYITPRPGMMLTDTAGVGWQYTLTAGGTAFAAAVSVTLATLTANLTTPTWFRADGRTTFGGGHSQSASLLVESYAGNIRVDWDTAGLASYIAFRSPSGAMWKVQPTVATGVLTAASIP